MNRKILFRFITIAGLLILLTAGHALAQGPIGTGFTYQGQLKQRDVLANGVYDFEFKLYDSASGDTQVGSAVSMDDVTVTDGLFAVNLDFGDVFSGSERWLQIAVREGSSTGAYTTLTPRQALTATPYALYSLAASNHDHWGETWSGSGVGLTLTSSDDHGLEITGGSAADDDGVVVNSAGRDGVYVSSAGDNGIFVNHADGDGVKVSTAGIPSTAFGTLSSDGFQVDGAEGNGLFVGRADDDGVYVNSAGNDGVHINSADNCGVYANGGSDMVDYGGIFNGYNGVKGYGFGANGYGVLGESDSADGYGGYFSNNASGGVDIMAAGTGIIKSEADSVLYLSPHDMVVRGSSGVDLIFRADGGVDIHSTTAGAKYLSIPVSTFGMLFGSPLYVKAVKVCYHKVGGGYIDITMVAKNSGSDGGYTSYIYNTTNRTSEAYTCYSVTDSSPLVIDNATWVQFNVNGGDHVVIHSVNLTLTETP